MFQLGADRVELITNNQRRARMESLSKYGTVLTVHGVDALVNHIRFHRRQIEAGVAGPTYAWLGPITEMAPQKVAATTMRVVLDQITQNTKLHALAIEVAEKLWIETMLCRATSWERKFHKRVRNRGDNRKRDIQRMRNTSIWDPRARLSTGVFLVGLVAQHTGLIEVYMEREGVRTVRKVRATPGCIDWIRQVETSQKLMSPLALPMVIPPRSWSTPLEGGYLTPEIPNNFLMKDDAEAVAEHTTGDEPFIRAANLQQTVAWKVNSWLLEQLQYAWDKSLEIGKLMPREGWAVPPYPSHLPSDHPDVTQWKFNARQIHEQNDRARHKKIATAKQLWLAKRFVDEPAIYFPMQLDFRGRYYYRPPFLNPQANDIGRALLLFANGTPIDNEEQADWLRVHGANAYGHGKLTWEARLAWVHQHQLEIEQAGRDPWSCSKFWAEADDPWQFLAFCREYQQFSHQGYGFISQLPIQLDCTCSGIQHYAALLRDQGMASLVNLMPSEKPQDIYTSVMQRVLDLLRNDDSPDAAKWLSLQPDRSLAKSIVMTLPYSASRRAVFGFCQDWALTRALELYGHDAWPFRRGAIGTCHYMATILYRETAELIGPAKDAMQWFKRVGKLAGEHNITLSWTSPAGLHVRQKYLDYSCSRIKLHHLSPVPMDLRSYHIPKGLSPKRMGNGLSPNVIHSLDASHMAFATIHAFEHGVRNLGGIHDCFATTPAEMAQLRDSVRATFAQLYSEDWFTRITDELIQQLPPGLQSTVQDRPKLGELDVHHVRNATYFIS